MITVSGLSIMVIHVRHDGRSYGVHAEDLGEFDGTKEEFLQLIENHLDLQQDSLNGYELDIVEETQNAVARPQAKFG